MNFANIKDNESLILEMSHAYYIPYAPRGTTSEFVKDAFNRAFDGDFVLRVDEGVTQDYKETWNSFKVHFKDTCVDDLFSKNMTFHAITDQYTLYYNETDFWVVHLIKV